MAETCGASERAASRWSSVEARPASIEISVRTPPGQKAAVARAVTQQLEQGAVGGIELEAGGRATRVHSGVSKRAGRGGGGRRELGAGRILRRKPQRVPGAQPGWMKRRIRGV